MTLRDRVAKAAETYLHQRADFAAPINFADLADAVIEAGLSERDAGWQPIESAPREAEAVIRALLSPSERHPAPWHIVVPQYGWLAGQIIVSDSRSNPVLVLNRDLPDLSAPIPLDAIKTIVLPDKANSNLTSHLTITEALEYFACPLPSPPETKDKQAPSQGDVS